MRRTHILLIAPLVATALSGADAADLLAKARAAFERNQKLEMHWNWTRTEARRLVDSTGTTVQELPTVTIESTVKTDGRRCEAVLAWSDGVEAYKLRAESDERCEATEQTRSSAFSLPDLLNASKATIRSQSATGVTLVISPDKLLQKSSDERVRCAASIRATILLDPATHFPRRLEGHVVDGGCDQQAEVTPTHYGETPLRGRARTLFRKGTRFRIEHELQPDKFHNVERSYWARTSQHFDIPRLGKSGAFIFWGRSVAIESRGRAQRMIQDFTLVAQQFGAQSRLVP